MGKLLRKREGERERERERESERDRATEGVVIILRMQLAMYATFSCFLGAVKVGNIVMIGCIIVDEINLLNEFIEIMREDVLLICIMAVRYR